MTIYKAEILADSIHSMTDERITTMRLTYPRMVHAEFMTHRLFARNASSSRAIPSKRQRAMIRADMAEPAAWGSNKPGMQAGVDVGHVRRSLARLCWRGLGHVALVVSAALDRLGLHKQIVNRVTEPWAHITVIVTAGAKGWANFYALRLDAAADPTIHKLADAAAKVHARSAPRVVEVGDCHAPLITQAERATMSQIIMLQVSAARCARTSYLNHDGAAPDVAKDLELYDRLMAGDPKHASPTEHQAEAMHPLALDHGIDGSLHANGWMQFRKMHTGERFDDLEVILTRYRNAV